MGVSASYFNMFTNLRFVSNNTFCIIMAFNIETRYVMFMFLVIEIRQWLTYDATVPGMLHCTHITSLV